MAWPYALADGNTALRRSFPSSALPACQRASSKTHCSPVVVVIFTAAANKQTHTALLGFSSRVSGDQ